MVSFSYRFHPCFINLQVILNREQKKIIVLYFTGFFNLSCIYIYIEIASLLVLSLKVTLETTAVELITQLN